MAKIKKTVKAKPVKVNIKELAMKLQAIDQIQAVIEFTMDGTVLTANDNFLKTLGYTLAEIKGQHHRMFCDAAYVASQEYQDFWAKLNRGEYDAGTYQRVGKGGKEVWIQAAYYPLRDSKGKLSKVVKFASDVTDKQVEILHMRDELKVREEIMNVTSIVSEANLKGDIMSVNEKFLQVSKYPKNELIGFGHNMMRHPDMPKEVFKQMWATIGRGQIFRGVVKNRAKDGTPYYVDAVIAPIVDKKTGKPRKYLGVRYDITEQEIQLQNMKGMMDAIDVSYAMIEFNLDGTILGANENFLKTMGYTLEEVKGKHHRMFADPVYAASSEYVAFWVKLNRGEFDAGICRRLGKGGKEVWIQASYNPIKDEMGRPFKVTKIAIDITAEKNRNAEQTAKLVAIGRAQAVIEFNLDGTIITANDNFLKTVGYSLEEVQGRHHRMFCDSSYTATGEYAAFWQKLSRGEFEAGVYRRLGKGGKEIWLQASYNPVLNAIGAVVKVVKFATEITAQKQAQIQLEACMGEVQVSLGALSYGDLTLPMQGTYEGELQKLKDSVNLAIGNLTSTISTVQKAVDSVTSGSEQITKGNEDLSQRTSEQASALEETAASMEEITSTVKQNADNAKRADQLAIAARETADKGGAVTKKAVDAMGEINKSSKKIADIITVIDEIAFQTNLLALNAAVEAARAGEHGRGFAVVAAEVRNLAQRSATAAKEIKGLINESIQRVSDGSELVNQSGKTLEDIVASVKRVSDIIAEISAASQEQASGLDQVNKAVMSMDETTQQNAALVEETTSAAQSMKEQARELMRQVEVFKLNGTETQGVSSSKFQVSNNRKNLPHDTRTLNLEPRTPQPETRNLKPETRNMKPETPAKAGVAGGNGKDRRSASEDFEEF